MGARKCKCIYDCNLAGPGGRACVPRSWDVTSAGRPPDSMHKFTHARKHAHLHTQTHASASRAGRNRIRDAVQTFRREDDTLPVDGLDLTQSRCGDKQSWKPPRPVTDEFVRFVMYGLSEDNEFDTLLHGILMADRLFDCI